MALRDENPSPLPPPHRCSVTHPAQKSGAELGLEPVSLSSQARHLGTCTEDYAGRKARLPLRSIWPSGERSSKERW